MQPGNSWHDIGTNYPSDAYIYPLLLKSRTQELIVGHAGWMPDDKHDRQTVRRVASRNEAVGPVSRLALIASAATEVAAETTQGELASAALVRGQGSGADLFALLVGHDERNSRIASDKTGIVGRAP
jgi:hypothetical protein